MNPDEESSLPLKYKEKKERLSRNRQPFSNESGII